VHVHPNKELTSFTGEWEEAEEEEGVPTTTPSAARSVVWVSLKQSK